MSIVSSTPGNIPPEMRAEFAASGKITLNGMPYEFTGVHWELGGDIPVNIVEYGPVAVLITEFGDFGTEPARTESYDWIEIIFTTPEGGQRARYYLMDRDSSGVKFTEYVFDARTPADKRIGSKNAAVYLAVDRGMHRFMVPIAPLASLDQTVDVRQFFGLPSTMSDEDIGSALATAVRSPAYR